MSRLLAVLGFVLLAVAALAATAGYLAYGPEPQREGSIEIARLDAPARVGWVDGHPVIEAESEAALAAALGYVHGVDAPWAVALWRQAALGDLAAWFGEGYVPYDRHARILGFGALARQTYRALSDSQRVRLDAYARGLNCAFAQQAVAQAEPFVLLDVEAEPFAPWHALAVERLVAWLGTTPPSDTLSGLPPTLAAFLDADAQYRALLLLGGARYGRAWAAPLGSASPAFVQHHAYGTSALPLVREATLRRGGRSVVAATVPGTLLLPGGSSNASAWSVFLTSTLTVAPTDAPMPPPAYDRLVDREGDETLLTLYRSSDGLFFEGDVPTPDTLRADSLAVPTAPPPATRWVISWPGFASGTDLSAWQALAEDHSATFRLFDGDGLQLSGADTGVLGEPAVQVALPGGVFVAADTLARHAARHLSDVLGAPESLDPAPSPEALATDTYSAWAADQIPGLLAALGDRDSLAPDLKDPYAYLLSWDARFEPDAIGASLFETWLGAHRDATGTYPSVADSADRPILQQTLRLAVAILKTRQDERPSAWRWENVQPGTRFFPIWTVGGEMVGPMAHRYEPLRPALGGHPTALLYGPSLLYGGPSGVWTAWTSGDGALTVRSPVVETDAFLGHERSTANLAAARRFALDARPETTLALVPPRE